MASNEVGGRRIRHTVTTVGNRDFARFRIRHRVKFVTDTEPLESLLGKGCDGVTDGDGVSYME